MTELGGTFIEEIGVWIVMVVSIAGRQLVYLCRIQFFFMLCLWYYIDFDIYFFYSYNFNIFDIYMGFILFFISYSITEQQILKE